MSKVRALVSAACVCLLVLGLGGCRQEDPVPTTEVISQTEATSQPASETTGAIDATQATEQTVADETQAPATEATEAPVLNAVAVDTDYGTLYYQEQWIEFMRTEHIADGDVLEVVFKAEIDGVTYPLFAIVIGVEEEDAVGTLTDGAGNVRNVAVRMEEIAITDGMSEGEQNRLYAMQEELNFVLDNLR